MIQKQSILKKCISEGLSVKLFKVFSFLRSPLSPAEGTLESEVVITTINTRIKYQLTATIRTRPLCQIDIFTPSLWGSVVHYYTKLLGWVDIKLFYKRNKNAKVNACTVHLLSYRRVLSSLRPYRSTKAAWTLKAGSPMIPQAGIEINTVNTWTIPWRCKSHQEIS